MNKLKNLRKGGFTLVELMVASSIGILTAGATMAFLTESVRTSLGITNNLDIDQSVRSLTNRLATEAREANGFVMYRTYFNRGHDMPGSFRRPADGFTAIDYRQLAGNSGNFCLFFYSGDDENPPVDPTTTADTAALRRPAPIERIVGYYLDTRGPRGTTEFEIRRFERRIRGDARFNGLESLIPGQGNNAIRRHEVVEEEVSTLATDALFINVTNRSVLVNGEILHDIPSRRSTGTYNFTISPRG